ncbi:hypothetical protein N7281_07240 [Rickettsia hoogstraalii]|uniref:hypothetical protein n=1 Tax=Rickettsia hoogstraalii TaxID=467174 RepID=UPI0022572881|nr:hypothetical protein [Rickettsia hoogstraalii]MCX4084603.1 hypothetical protein [Rickettsia hoogstraalii]
MSFLAKSDIAAWISKSSLRGAKRRGNLVRYPEIASSKLVVSSRSDGKIEPCNKAEITYRSRYITKPK